MTAYSLGFTRNGSQLLCGFSKCIRIFSTATPGRRVSQVISTHGKPLYHGWVGVIVLLLDSKSKLGQTGIISCFAFHPTDDNMFAAGSYSGSGTSLFTPQCHIHHLLFLYSWNLLT